MTEEDWLSCSDPGPMLEYVRGRTTDRKMRLFACACCRRVWRLIIDARYRRVVEVAERHADGLAGEGERAEARAAGVQAGDDWRQGAAGRSSMESWLVLRAYRAASVTLEADIGRSAAACMLEAARAEGIEELMAQNRQQPGGDEFIRFLKRLMAPYLAPLRCVMGNPFRPVRAEPAWLASTVVALARGIYEERAFERMVYLADALMDAGCENEEVLEHCRGPNNHVRGCWVVDAVLGRS
jgi:hypothetical protein